MTKPALRYTLRPDKSVRDEVIRILDEIAACARSLAAESSEPGDESVHEGRLLIKRLRALMWLARPALGMTVYRKTQADLREAAGLLAGQRDLVAARTTLEKLKRQASRPRDEEDIARLCGSEMEGPFSGAGEAVVSIGKFREAMGVVGAVVGELKHGAEAGGKWPSPRRRLEQASQAARKAGRKARESNSDLDFHTWRKKAKRLLYLLELTQPLPTRHMGHLIARVEKLQDELGQYHDQVVTEDRLRTMNSVPSSARRVLQLLARSKKRLGKKARKIKRKIGRL